MQNRAARIMAGMGAFMLTCTLAQGGERVEFRGSTSVELPKPKRALDTESRTPRVESSKPNLEGGFVAPPVESSLNNRKLREELDRKRNWIFMNPYEQQFDSKTEEFLGGEKASGLYDHHWMTSDEEKTLVHKFLEERDARPESRRSSSDPRSDESRDDPRLPADPTAYLDPAEQQQQFLQELPGADLDRRVFKTELFEDPFRSGSFEKGIGRGLPGENPFTSRRPAATAISKEELMQKQLSQEREFDQILNGKLGAGTSVGRLDSLNLNTGLGTGIGQMDFNKSPNRSPGLGRVGIGSSTTATFTDGGAGFSARSGIAGPDLSESFTVMPKAPAPAFAPAVPQAPVTQRPTFSPAPFTFQVPQRKF